MNTLNKTLIVVSVIGAAGISALVGDAVVNAESGASSDGPMSGLVDKIASTFNLDKSKVQDVFDDQRAEMESQREQKISERLDALVSDGTITESQKSAIKTKHAELKKEREANKGEFKELSDEERKTKMDEKRTELESWAEEQGIDLTKIKGVFGGPGGRGGLGGPR